jgi:TonB-linked SusC/RagA family outer membrane protein
MFKKLQLLALALFLPLCASAQSGSLTGKVTDAKTGEPLTGATVIIQSLTKGASADINGDYTITGIPAGSYQVVTQFVGYKSTTNTVEIGSGSVTLDIEMAVDLVGLEELVITGYGSVNRANLTSSISKVSRKEIEESPVVSADALLQGKAAGVQINSDSGTPGGGVSVRIRGASSISANNDPLYVVDGIPLNSGSNSAFGVGNQQLNAISDLNPNEIESIEILKDASATAIYGSRGANGVVLITTRRGVAGDSKINVNISSGFKEFPNELEFVNSEQFIEMYVDGLYGDFFGYANWGTYNDRFTTFQNFLAANGLTYGTYAGLGEIDDFGANPADAPYTDWQDAVFETGVTQNYSINASGGDVKTRYYISGDYYDEKGIMYDEKGIMRNSGFERINGRLNLDHSINEKASISTSVSYLRSVSERLENDNNIYGVLTNSYLSYPTRSIRNADGTFNSSVGAFSNAVSASEVFNEAVRTRFIGNLKGEYQFTDEFKVTGSLGLDRYDLNEDTYSPSFTNQGSPLGSGGASVGITQTWITEVQAQYNTVFSDVHT